LPLIDTGALVDVDTTYTLSELRAVFALWIDHLQKEFAGLAELQGVVVIQQCQLPRRPPGTLLECFKTEICA
jgi:hypothetical protein